MPTLWRYLEAQIISSPLDAPQTTKHERVYNFVNVPHRLEQFLFLGYWVCFDAFLYNFTILPLRIVLNFIRLVQNFIRYIFRQERRPTSYGDVLKGLILVFASLVIQKIDSSRLYHSIRGQSTLKLYVIYNVLEVADKLCCSFGLDILDSFFSPKPSSTSEARLKPIFHLTLAVVYVIAHTVLLFYQVTTLNVAINSYSQALLTLLVSNQFVEIKSAVFKKFEKENLFQLSCADVVERFQLTLYLLIIGVRNMSEMRNSLDSDFALVGLFLPLAIVYVSEIFVDWIKHAFITKFNHIQPVVYLKFCGILAQDFESSAGNSLTDKSPQVSKRIGFSAFPLLIRVFQQFIEVYDIPLGRWLTHSLLTYFCLLLVKLISGINLAAYCKRRVLAQQASIRSQQKRWTGASQSQTNLRSSGSLDSICENLSK